MNETFKEIPFPVSYDFKYGDKAVLYYLDCDDDYYTESCKEVILVEYIILKNVPKKCYIFAKKGEIIKLKKYFIKNKLSFPRIKVYEVGNLEYFKLTNKTFRSAAHFDIFYMLLKAGFDDKGNPVFGAFNDFSYKNVEKAYPYFIKDKKYLSVKDSEFEPDNIDACRYGGVGLIQIYNRRHNL